MANTTPCDSFVLLMFATCSFASPLHAALAIGDLAVVGLNSDASDNIDDFAMVALAPISGSEVIRLTDRGWKSGFYTDNDSTEGTLEWRPGVDIDAGTILRVSVDLTAGSAAGLPGTLTILDGFLGGTAGIFTGGGDQVLIYQGDQSSPNFIFGLNTQATTSGGAASTGEWMGSSGALSATSSTLPPLLTNGSTALALTVSDHADNVVYTGATVGTKEQLLSSITDGSNWSKSDTDPFDLAAAGSVFPSQFTIVPEPTVAVLAFGGLAGIFLRRRRLS